MQECQSYSKECSHFHLDSTHQLQPKVVLLRWELSAGESLHSVQICQNVFLKLLSL